MKKLFKNSTFKKQRSWHLGPTTSQQRNGETMETVTEFMFLGSKMTVDADCSHEIKKHLILGRKAMTNLDSVLKKETLLCLQMSI